MNTDRPTSTRTDISRTDSSADGDGDTDEWVILNPVSGDGTHADHVHRLAADRGFRVLETDREGDAARYAREAVRKNISELAVCGGDGTLKEVLSGFEAAAVLRTHADGDGTDRDDRADESERGGTDGQDGSAPILSVIPAGTANIFATDMGITTVDEGFETLDTGEVRYLDVGLADGDPFMKSCIAGLTADASSAASDDLKERFGSLAFVITGVERAATFDPLGVEIEVDADAVDPDAGFDFGLDFSLGSDAGDDTDPDADSDGGTTDGEDTDTGWVWSGEALCLVVGNARRYAGEIGQANVEDGLLDVTLVEEMPPGTVVTEAIGRQLLGRETENVTRLKASRIEVGATDRDSIEFSLDGEIANHEHLSITVRERAVPVRVGPTYEPMPSDSTHPSNS